MRFARVYLLLASLFVSSAALGACGDDPLFPDVLLTIDTVTLTVPESNLASALDLARIQPPYILLRRPELVRDASAWDFALRRTEGGGLALRPFDAPGSPYRGSGIATTTEDFDRIDEAPRGNARYSQALAPVSVGTVWYMRSRQYPSATGQICLKYAKARALEVDAAAGTVKLALVLNDNCDDERLVDD
ncbi:MAG TPA: hypothetical protein VFQ76_10035 [Longimicrobiaceae bacterium]|nr:hypothetical protein [Longimicrobiaceae bacterium]